ncbi:MAG: hypothetical protein DHS20C21_17630 [Gemmatimonadota bacterium]|nr:MAG: hypothetical protein DHS20C21_17630 [Gemmatimonadota bacterium]
MRGTTAVALVIAVWAALTPEAQGQVMRELDPIALEYRILWGEPLAPVGSASVAFSPVDTKRGRRLEVESTIQYTLPRDTPFHYEEESKLVCDEEGVASFETTARALGKERINVAIRMGDDYHVTTTFQDKKKTKTITSGVQRTNFGLFAGGFMDEALNQGDLLRDYPLLFPVGGDHQPRQKYREAVLPFVVSADKRVRSIVTRIKRPNDDSDRLWNTVEGHQILLRMEEQTTQGLMVYELLSVNGVSAGESEYIQ